MDVFPVAQIREGRIVVYNEYHGFSSKRGKNPLSKNNLRREVYKGIISKAAKKSISTKIEAWASTLTEGRLKSLKKWDGNPMQMIMITLTLPSEQVHDDQVVKRLMLNRFLIIAARRWYIDRYIWRAERQLNGNIHFHIITDKFVPKDSLRGVWNSILSDLGYIDTFEQKHGHRSPPSTDVSIIRSIKMAGYYIQKYMAKETDCQVIKGAVWGCSDTLKKLKSPVFAIDVKVNNFLSEVSSSSGTRIVRKENCTMIYGSILSIMKSKHGEMYREWRNEIEEIWRNAFHSKNQIRPEISLVAQAHGQKVWRQGSRTDGVQLSIQWN